MFNVFIYFFLSMLATALVIPFIRKFSHRIGYVDKPSGDALKIHDHPIPHSGGIALFGIFIACTVFLCFTGRLGGDGVVSLWLGGSIVFFMGVWDDLKSLSQFPRLLGAAAAGGVVVVAGYGFKAAFIISLPLTIFYVVGAINAFNMQDGIDGLAGGLAGISFVGFASVSVFSSRQFDYVISISMLGILIGFLWQNFHPAKIFMGDSGSYFVGFMLACLAVRVTGFNRLALFIALILIIGMPVFDAAYAIVRRLMRGGSPFSGDRSHFYDQLMQMGLSMRQTVVICWGIQAVFVACGVWVYFI